jgi:hypothetical protein
MKPSQRKRRTRKPTLASVAKHAKKAGVEVARCEVEPDKIVIVVGKSSMDNAAVNEWDEVYSNGAAKTAIRQ